MLDFLSRNGSVEPSRIFYGSGDVSPFTFSLLFLLVSVSATFKHDEVCHVGEVLKVIDDEQRTRTRDNRSPDLGGMSLGRNRPRLENRIFLARGASQQRRW